VADTDGDGLSDGAEVFDAGPLTDADPLHHDLFVEIDYMRGERPNRTALQLVVERWANAPVDNPDGEQGIDVHVVLDDQLPRANTTTEREMLRIGQDNFDRFGEGFYYGAFVVDAVLDGEDTTGFASPIGLVMEHFPEREEEAHIFMHELGHAAGLSDDTYVGIDSREVPFSEYPSAMNYNAPFDIYRFASGANTTFDDWAYIEANFVQPPTDRLTVNASATSTEDGS
jgi:hypothetical protein